MSTAANSAVSLSLRQKIGQLLIVGFRGLTPAECGPIVSDIRENHIGGIILFDQEMAGGTVDSGPRRRNIESPAQVKTSPPPPTRRAWCRMPISCCRCSRRRST